MLSGGIRCIHKPQILRLKLVIRVHKPESSKDDKESKRERSTMANKYDTVRVM